MTISLFSLNVILPTILVIIILVTVLWILYSKNRKLKNVLDTEEKRFSVYKNGIEKLKNSSLNNPEKEFEILNKYSRAFFKEYFQFNYSLTYLELEESFKKLGKDDFANFCRLMSDVDYSGKKTTEKEIKTLVNIFYKLLSDFSQ